MRISRTLPTRNGVNDVDFSLNSYKWIPQWINDYFFSAALLQIAVSIITISYNSEKTIEATLRSVINQTHKNVQHIIIDGGWTAK